MEAKFVQNGDILVVCLKGRVDYETVETFRRTCLNYLIHHKVIFDLKELSFVGSIGITDLVSTLADMTQQSLKGVKFSHVASEFRRVLQSSHIKSVEIYEDAEKARMSFMGYEMPKVLLQPILTEEILEDGAEVDTSPDIVS